MVFHGLLFALESYNSSIADGLGGPSAMSLGFTISVIYFFACIKSESRSSWELFCLVFLQIFLNTNTLYS